MKRQRRRARDEMLAPWVAGAVILGGWGLAAQFSRHSGNRIARQVRARQP